MQSEFAAPAAPAGLKKAGIVAAVIAVGVVGVGAWSRHHQRSETQNWADAQAIPTVHLIPVGKPSASTPLTLPGTVQAWDAAKIYARVAGYLKTWSKDIGADVSAGAPLGTIDAPELDQQILQAKATLVRARADAGLAKSTAARWNDLLTTNSVSHQEADEKNGDLAARNAAVQVAEADLGRLMAMKGFTTLRAPFAGVVTVRSAEIGDLVGPGASAQQPLFAVADLHKMRIYVNVPQSYSAALKPGLSATVTVPDYPGRKWPARVVGASGAISGQSGTFQVQLVTDNADRALKAGAYANVVFDISGQGGTVTIPSSTLIFRAAGTQVATIRSDGHVHMLSVSVGRDLGGTVEITHGLQAGGQIVDNPPDSISEGELVRVGAKKNG